MAKYEKSAEYTRLAREAIKTVPELNYIADDGIRVCYMVCDTAKKISGKRVCADCRLVEELYRNLVPYDFIITIYEPNVETFTKNQKLILLWHELLHVAVNEKTLEPVYGTRAHDVEEFQSIIDKVGLYWDEDGASVPTFKGLFE